MASTSQPGVPFITLFETESTRVKSISFHPTRPWLLAALHTGTIQLWDYRIKTLIDKFEQHKGPIRSVAFHPKLPLFVSGGDDDKIKVWNYKERRCLFTLSDHLDYIRSVEFHHEYPWILSASDDQTIRIWNWQSRQCVSVMTGHSHYVMSAKFHPTEDLVLSASLDSTVRVWDISALRKKNVVPTGDHPGLQIQNDLFGNTDVAVKFELHGHEGVNWASFHPTLPLIISGSDDRLLKLWRWSDTKAWEVDTLRAHYNSVTACVFHPTQEIMISCGEDKTVRIWDMSQRSLMFTYRKEQERFWVVAAHPERNLFAAGHDFGLILFKLEKERPAMCIHRTNSSIFYLKDRYIRHFEFETGKDVPVMATKAKKNSNPRSLQYNPAGAMLVTFEENGGSYELYTLSKGSPADQQSSESKRGSGKSAVWIARNRFAVWDVKANSILIKGMNGETSKSYPSPIQGTTIEGLFAANNGCVLLKLDNKLVLYDLQQKREVTECASPPIVKFVHWSNQEADAMVAVLSKDSLFLATSRLEILCSITERTKIKSGIWNDEGVFLYTTTSHIKYVLPNGDHGIVRTLDQPIYLTGAIGSKLFCLDREAKNRAITVDATEFQFKHALLNKRYQDVLNIVRGATILGQSIVSYLQQKGFPEVALNFVKEDQTKFDLALECGNIEKALDSALKLEQADVWVRLAEAALHHGNHAIVELAYQKTNNYERLSFLYLITGQIQKLKQMEKFAEKRGDLMSLFHNTLYLGDIPTRIKTLEMAGQLSLAYLTAKTHGLEDVAGRIKTRLLSKLESDGVLNQNTDTDGVENHNNSLPANFDVDSKMPLEKNSRLLLPPRPLFGNEEGTWPLLAAARGPFDAFLYAPGAPAGSSNGQSSLIAANFAGDLDDPSAALGTDSGWTDDDIVIDEQGNALPKVKQQPQQGSNTGPNGDAETGEQGGAWDLDLQIDEALPPLAKPTVEGPKRVVLPKEGPSTRDSWLNSDVPSDHVAAGNFETAMELLHRQLGIVNFDSLKPYFLKIAAATQAHLAALPSTQSIELNLSRNWQAFNFETIKDSLPINTLNLPFLVEKLQVGYRSFTLGKFQEALESFKSILHALPLICVSNTKEASEAKELIGIVSDYVMGLNMELKRKSTDVSQIARIAELSTYFTHCNLQPSHLQLTLRSAMNFAVKIKNFASAYNFGRRLLDLAPKPDIAQTTQRILQLCEQNGLKDEVQMNYDERNPFVICNGSFTPIYRGTPAIACPYCGAHYLSDFNGTLCTLCEMSTVGANVTGLTLVRAPPKRPQKRSLNDDNE